MLQEKQLIFYRITFILEQQYCVNPIKQRGFNLKLIANMGIVNFKNAY